MGAKFVIELAQTRQTSPDLELPSSIVYPCIPLGAYLMCFRFLQAAHVEGIEPVDATSAPGSAS
jgi:C4-dicarboxylate transporter, DctQ subunit